LLIPHPQRLCAATGGTRAVKQINHFVRHGSCFLIASAWQKWKKTQLKAKASQGDSWFGCAFVLQRQCAIRKSCRDQITTCVQPYIGSLAQNLNFLRHSFWWK